MKTILLTIDHGLTLAYFLYTDVARLWLEKGVRLVFLVEDELIPWLRQEFGSVDHLVFDSAREVEASQYKNTYRPALQELMEYMRKSTASPRIPLTYVDTHRQRKEFEAEGRWKFYLRAARPAISLLRHSRLLRRSFRHLQSTLFTPRIYEDLLDQYRPDLLISGSAGWKQDCYILREAKRRGIKTATMIIGWDNPSAHGLPGANVDYVNVWSDIHKWELNAGLDWPAKNIHVGGMPLYDNYIDKKWLMPRQAYFDVHKLDSQKPLIAYVATALSISPNLHIVELLTDIVRQQKLAVPVQLLIRLHPNHFRPTPHYQKERAEIYRVVGDCANVRIAAPTALANEAIRYSGTDFPEKASMLAYCDVLVSIYSTMVLEAALHDKPIISACIDSPEGWPGHFWIPLSQVPSWPTASRVNRAGASTTVFTSDELITALNAYLKQPGLHASGRQQFAQQELTYLHGEATQKTADFILSLLGISHE